MILAQHLLYSDLKPLCKPHTTVPKHGEHYRPHAGRRLQAGAVRVGQALHRGLEDQVLQI